MTIPLDTYDPDWQKNWDAIHAEIQAESALPYSDERYDRLKKLDAELRAAYHAQFRTTGDYASWSEDMLRKQASFKESMEDFKIPTFPPNNSVEATNNLYTIVSNKMDIVDKAETWGCLPLDYPTGDQPFAHELRAGDARVQAVVNHEFMRPVFENNTLVGVAPSAEPYTCVIERRHSTANACFFQLHGDGPSPVNCIEELATALYDAELGPGSAQQNRDAYLPEEVNIYIYFPPYYNGEEKFWKIGLTWDVGNKVYINPEWDHLTEVPYILRKLAAADGLAKDPGPPLPSAKGPGGSNSSPGHDVKQGPK